MSDFIVLPEGASAAALYGLPITAGSPLQPEYFAVLPTQQQVLPTAGVGYLAGDFPGGITTLEGAPIAATIRVHLRKSGSADGVLVAETNSGPDGTWRVNGLNPSLRYDVVGRLDGHNDVILANVQPVLTEP